MRVVINYVTVDMNHSVTMVVNHSATMVMNHSVTKSIHNGECWYYNDYSRWEFGRLDQQSVNLPPQNRYLGASHDS